MQDFFYNSMANWRNKMRPMTKIMLPPAEREAGRREQIYKNTKRNNHQGVDVRMEKKSVSETENGAAHDGIRRVKTRPVTKSAPPPDHHTLKHEKWMLNNV